MLALILWNVPTTPRLKIDQSLDHADNVLIFVEVKAGACGM